MSPAAGVGTIPIRVAAADASVEHYLRPGTLELPALPPLSLYVHWPWCVRKCPYCDFNSHESAGPIPEASYLDALRADLEAALPLVWGRPVTSVFIGGGTPSLMSAAGLDRLLSDIRALLPNYTGTINQIPPQFSAIKISGERAYDLARDGETVDIPSREVEVHRLTLLKCEADKAHFEVECGKGTYVRSLARDFGRDLGCYGHISSLRRTFVAPFAEETMVPLAELVALEAIEDRDERRIAMAESIGECNRLESGARIAMQQQRIDAAGSRRLDRCARRGRRRVGAVVEHLDREPVARPVERRQRRNRARCGPWLVVERQLHEHVR